MRTHQFTESMRPNVGIDRETQHTHSHTKSIRGECKVIQQSACGIGWDDDGETTGSRIVNQWKWSRPNDERAFNGIFIRNLLANGSWFIFYFSVILWCIVLCSTRGILTHFSRSPARRTCGSGIYCVPYKQENIALRAIVYSVFGNYFVVPMAEEGSPGILMPLM